VKQLTNEDGKEEVEQWELPIQKDEFNEFYFQLQNRLQRLPPLIAFMEEESRLAGEQKL